MIHDLLVDALSVAILTVITVLTAALRSLILSKVQDQHLQTSLLRLTDATEAAVKEVEQVYVREVKKGLSDGQLTDKEKVSAKEKAMESLKTQLGGTWAAKAQETLGLSAAAFEKMLSARIEAKVAERKDPKPGTAQAVAAVVQPQLAASGA